MLKADFDTATLCLQENMKILDGNRTVEQSALWNLSNALLVVLDALREIDGRTRRPESR